MLMHTLPHQTIAFLAPYVISTYRFLTSTKTYEFTLLVPSLPFTNTNTMPRLFFFFFLLISSEAIAPNLSVALQPRESRILFIYNFPQPDTGRASTCCREISGTSCMWLPGKVSLQTGTHTHTQQNCTTHLRRFACHTDLFKHSDVFHFAGLQFRMYYTDRHTANPQHCLSASHSVSSLLLLIQFIIFFSPTYNKRDPSETPPF